MDAKANHFSFKFKEVNLQLIYIENQIYKTLMMIPKFLKIILEFFLLSLLQVGLSEEDLTMMIDEVSTARPALSGHACVDQKAYFSVMKSCTLCNIFSA